jgi:UDP-3-O-[3-hydroxymyristoyl] glucosamine N-acyltransferase
MEITLSGIAEITGGKLVGDGARVVRGVCSPGNAVDDMLCIVWERSLLPLVPAGVPVLSGVGAVLGRDGVEMVHPKLALPKILPMFDRRTPQELGIHPNAALCEGCIIGNDVSIGPGCVISKDARIGDRCALQANVFVGRGVVIGDDSRMEAGVALLDFVEIGRRVVIHSGVRVGCDGFGFVPGESGRWEKIPQIGSVVIEDDVEIGSNGSVDRATFGVTRIGAGTKLGTLVHVAHNCEIGKNCVMSGYVALGGSARIGDGTIIAGMVGVADHVTIGHGVTIAGRSGVTKDIPDGVTVSGFPAREHRQENRLQASLRRVPSYLERVRELERELEELKSALEKDR